MPNRKTVTRSDQTREVAFTRRVGLVIGVAAGVVAAWNARHDLNPDGLSFLDIADALQRGQWSAALNGYWNPLYPTLLALFARPATIGPAWEFAAAHAVNFAIYLGALFSFDALLRKLPQSAPAASLPHRDWLLIGYAAFLWATVGLVRLDVVTPDLLVMMCLNLALLFFLRAEARPADQRALLAAAGALLGLGYLAKTVMLPVTLLFLLSTVFVASYRRTIAVASGFTFFVASGFSRKGRADLPPYRLRPALVTDPSSDKQGSGGREGGSHVFSVILPIALGLLLIAGPYITAMSLERGRLTTGESGRLNFAWKVGGMTSYFFPSATEAVGLAHPPRVLCVSPPAFEFGGMPVTYPPWYDPAYWFEGLTPRFTWRGQVEVLRNGALTGYLMLRQAWPLVALFFFLIWAAPSRRRFQRLGRDSRVILLTCVLALAMYAVVEFSLRLNAPFMPPLIAVAFLLPSRPERSERWQRVAGPAAAVLMLTIVLQPVLARSLDEVSQLKRGVAVHEHLEMANQLRSLGLQPGDPLAVVGEGYGAYWARLARARVVAEAPDPEKFWQATPEDRSRCIERFRSTGARVLVTFRARRDGMNAWQPLGSTGYDALVFR